MRVALLFVVLAAGLAAGWFVGGGREASVAKAEEVPFIPASSTQLAAFTPPAEVKSLVTIKSSAQFGGTGSNYVCDRERLVAALAAKPDHLKAWARVQGQRPTADAVAGYIRKLRAVTLVEPTRVTDHAFVKGRAEPAQAMLAQGTAVLVDADDVVRVRCRSGSPLRPPVIAEKEECKGCPETFQAPPPLLSSPSYVVHPAPPPAKGDVKSDAKPVTRPTTIQVVKRLPVQQVEQRSETDAEGKTVVKTVTVTKEGTPQPPVIKIKRVPGPTRTVIVRRTRTRTVQVPVVRTRTVVVEKPVIRYRTQIVYEGSG
ncbi:hypothetical protein DVA67_030500 [Solirubrobacter sp. CPCC 204708]|uniref:DUF6777 domain-containing protein n=1 Tax=Solirubrobacter deserti TaxID=2282478 RepID=A0ABT4RII0_9ACTN|nr:DUF6777 domain-containing protein [Solirubrobacter deserti]MBE2320334.1 hypothetical protein [Solirubrobacter deserti]MDA0138283.1 hypothetical protein [Solirubrobacter deserti]